MNITLPIVHQELVDGEVKTEEKILNLQIDTSVYSEERWEQNFPALAEKEGLFQYIERIQQNSVTERVKVACMLKAIYCFVESSELRDYKSFAQLFNLAIPDYTSRLINTLKSAFNSIIGSSSVKN